eukprot:jgi/Mesen1/5900/ME000003S06924
MAWPNFDHLKRLRDSYNEADLVEPGLYLGAWGAAQDKAGLEEKNVTHVLTVASGLGKAPHLDTFTYTIISIEDTSFTNISKHFETCFEVIDAGREAGGVLVHCMAGVSRSATVVVAYLMRTHGWPLQKALEHVKRCRPVVHPNEGFLRQLREFEKKLAEGQAPLAVKL